MPAGSRLAVRQSFVEQPVRPNSIRQDINSLRMDESVYLLCGNAARKSAQGKQPLHRPAAIAGYQEAPLFQVLFAMDGKRAPGLVDGHQLKGVDVHVGRPVDSPIDRFGDVCGRQCLDPRVDLRRLFRHHP